MNKLPEFIRQVLLPVGGRGGVGKTFVIALLAAWLRSLGLRIQAIDLDDENKKGCGLAHFVPDAERVDLHATAGLDVLLDLSQSEGDAMLVDFPAASSYVALPWFQEMQDAVKELGLRFMVICVITDYPGSLESTLLWADALQDTVDYIVVLNPLGDRNATFSYWKDARQAMDFRKAFRPCAATSCRTLKWPG